MKHKDHDYKKLLSQLESLKQNSQSFIGDEPGSIWQADVDALDEAMDIIYDYQSMAQAHREMIDKYETEQPVIRRGMDLYQCPACGKRTSRNHTHCHWCGKKLGWR